jgi:hypothetical protein
LTARGDTRNIPALLFELGFKFKRPFTGASSNDSRRRAGGVDPLARARVENACGALCYDHAGATEVGAFGLSCAARDGMHVNEVQFVAEVVDAARCIQGVG